MEAALRFHVLVHGFRNLDLRTQGWFHTRVRLSVLDGPQLEALPGGLAPLGPLPASEKGDPSRMDADEMYRGPAYVEAAAPGANAGRGEGRGRTAGGSTNDAAEVTTAEHGAAGVALVTNAVRILYADQWVDVHCGCEFVLKVGDLLAGVDAVLPPALCLEVELWESPVRVDLGITQVYPHKPARPVSLSRTRLALSPDGAASVRELVVVCFDEKNLCTLHALVLGGLVGGSVLREVLLPQGALASPPTSLLLAEPLTGGAEKYAVGGREVTARRRPAERKGGLMGFLACYLTSTEGEDMVTHPLRSWLQHVLTFRAVHDGLRENHGEESDSDREKWRMSASDLVACALEDEGVSPLARAAAVQGLIRGIFQAAHRALVTRLGEVGACGGAAAEAPLFSGCPTVSESVQEDRTTREYGASDSDVSVVISSVLEGCLRLDVEQASARLGGLWHVLVAGVTRDERGSCHARGDRGFLKALHARWEAARMSQAYLFIIPHPKADWRGEGRGSVILGLHAPALRRMSLDNSIGRPFGREETARWGAFIGTRLLDRNKVLLPLHRPMRADVVSPNGSWHAALGDAVFPPPWHSLASDPHAQHSLDVLRAIGRQPLLFVESFDTSSDERNGRPHRGGSAGNDGSVEGSGDSEDAGSTPGGALPPRIRAAEGWSASKPISERSTQEMVNDPGEGSILTQHFGDDMTDEGRAQQDLGLEFSARLQSRSHSLHRKASMEHGVCLGKHTETLVHLFVFVHGYHGGEKDLRFIRTHLQALFFSEERRAGGAPGARARRLFLLSKSNEREKSSAPLQVLGERLSAEVFDFLKEQGCAPGRVSKITFVGHSMGNLIVRSCLCTDQFASLLTALHCFVSISGPHLGFTFNNNRIQGTGMRLLRMAQSAGERGGSLDQLSMRDRPREAKATGDLSSCYLFRLAVESGPILARFRHLVLMSSPQDKYVPYHAARLEHSIKALRRLSSVTVDPSSSVAPRGGDSEGTSSGISTPDPAEEESTGGADSADVHSAPVSPLGPSGRRGEGKLERSGSVPLPASVRARTPRKVSTSKEGEATSYVDMLEALLLPLREAVERKYLELLRVDVHFPDEYRTGMLDNAIGRAGHVAFLEKQSWVETFVWTHRHLFV